MEVTESMKDTLLSTLPWPVPWLFAGAVLVLAAAAIVFGFFYVKGWWDISTDAAFRREVAGIDKELAEVEDTLRPVIGLATARDRAMRAAWEREQFRMQQPPDDDDGFLADGNSDDERVRATVRRRGVPAVTASLPVTSAVPEKTESSA